jgi:uncharacterized protein
VHVAHVPERSRYELRDGEALLGVAEYVDRDEVRDVHHTEIVRERRGKGLGDVLVAGVLADVRATGLRVRPTCWFVDAYLRHHPEVADLRA